jgi:hypothetical protein
MFLLRKLFQNILLLWKEYWFHALKKSPLSKALIVLHGAQFMRSTVLRFLTLLQWTA